MSRVEDIIWHEQQAEALEEQGAGLSAKADDLRAQVSGVAKQADGHRWIAAELISAELATGKTQRQLAGEIGKSDRHVSRMAWIWRTHGKPATRESLAWATLWNEAIHRSAAAEKAEESHTKGRDGKRYPTHLVTDVERERRQAIVAKLWHDGYHRHDIRQILDPPISNGTIAADLMRIGPRQNGSIGLRPHGQADEVERIKWRDPDVTNDGAIIVRLRAVRPVCEINEQRADKILGYMAADLEVLEKYVLTDDQWQRWLAFVERASKMPRRTEEADVG